MTRNELKAAGWKASRNGFTFKRGDCRIYLSLVTGETGLCEVALLWAPGIYRCEGGFIPMTDPYEEGIDAALASLGTRSMPNGYTVREWALSP